jgi:hypothetical protein
MSQENFGSSDWLCSVPQAACDRLRSGIGSSFTQNEGEQMRDEALGRMQVAAGLSAQPRCVRKTGETFR